MTELTPEERHRQRREADQELADAIKFQREAIQEGHRNGADSTEGAVGKIQMDGSASPREQAAAIVAEDIRNAQPEADGRTDEEKDVLRALHRGDRLTATNGDRRLSDVLSGLVLEKYAEWDHYRECWTLTKKGLRIVEPLRYRRRDTEGRVEQLEKDIADIQKFLAQLADHAVSVNDNLTRIRDAWKAQR